MNNSSEHFECIKHQPNASPAVLSDSNFNFVYILFLSLSFLCVVNAMLHIFLRWK